MGGCPWVAYLGRSSRFAQSTPAPSDTGTPAAMPPRANSKAQGKRKATAPPEPNEPSAWMEHLGKLRRDELVELVVFAAETLPGGDQLKGKVLAKINEVRDSCRGVGDERQGSCAHTLSWRAMRTYAPRAGCVCVL